MATNIHTTAIIERGAELDEDVTVGPYAYIGANVSRLSQHTVEENLYYKYVRDEV